MALSKYKIGELIELVQESNTELEFGPDDVMGMTITKDIIPTKADVNGADLSKYIVVKPNEFIYNPRTHGKKLDLDIIVLESHLLLVGTTSLLGSGRL